MKVEVLEESVVLRLRALLALEDEERVQLIGGEIVREVNAENRCATTHLWYNPPFLVYPSNAEPNYGAGRLCIRRVHPSAKVVEKAEV
jgi:hypothetical protein